MFIYPDLAEKNVVVTGASGDIGLSVCEKYLDLRSRVFALYHTSITGLQQLQTTHPHGAQLIPIQCDVSDPAAAAALAHRLEAEAGHVDVLINNAGICKDNLFTSMTYEEFDQVVKTNLYGTFNTCKALLRLLRQAKGATIVNVSSIAGVTASFGQVNYSAAKSGINGLTRTMAKEYATKGIRINAVAPGMIESRMVKKVPRQIVRGIVDAIALQRLGKTEEISNVIVFLSSQASSYIVGQVLIADGGLLMF